ncbi:hypothetical protein [Desulfobotulus mexicanus]|uniref:DUF45 domain-containing protein n=1 Tax=Desulfobotulus mexicanus TaxID=2586642 RepID=A0A5Q4VGE6_9BACT|nr:hypothetical protein [Desulfobotulus mexicanus]TYT75061.1 hypothetical protein FIM25_06590 [Desulfobotulus mexicanus]
MKLCEGTVFFSGEMLEVLDMALPVAEESVAGFYKMSTSGWGRLRYDVKTAKDLFDHEHAGHAYAQVLRYVGIPWQRSTQASVFTAYRICLQDGSILRCLRENRQISELPFLVYILVHELVHVVRFSRHLQLFEASSEVRMQEEKKVQEVTDRIASEIMVSGMDLVRSFFYDNGGSGLDVF